jgi:hypothetical protein
MDLDLFRKIIDEAGDFIEFMWLHFFGEPLLNPNIYSMIDYAEASGICTGLSTTATPLTVEAASRLLDSPLSLLLVSLDGLTVSTYEHLRAGARLSQVLPKVESFAALKRDSRESKLKSVLSIIEVNANKNERDRFVEHWMLKGFDACSRKAYPNRVGFAKNALSLVPLPNRFLEARARSIRLVFRWEPTCDHPVGVSEHQQLVHLESPKPR